MFVHVDVGFGSFAAFGSQVAKIFGIGLTYMVGVRCFDIELAIFHQFATMIFWVVLGGLFTKKTRQEGSFWFGF